MNEQNLTGMELMYPGSRAGEIALARHRYSYSAFSKLETGVEASLPVSEFTMLVLSGSFSMAGRTVVAGQVARASGVEFRAVALENDSSLLVAGVEKSETGPTLEIFSVDEAKRVSKPWGYELWLSGEGMQCSLKKIYLKQGNRTSLQYHRQKRETNYIFAGEPELTVKRSDAVSLDEVRPEHLGSVSLRTPVSVDIQPFTLHRLTAGSDLIMYEASTPELDDVVRVADDSNRGHGRISSEH